MSEQVRSPVAPGAVVGGKYRVERVLGAGGMGVVVAAEHTELGQPVALKFILPEAVSGKDAIERFMREARAVARLKSEHVARVYDVGRDESGNPYMVLELLEGQDLAKLNKNKGPLPVADAVEYVLQACEALVEAHAAGIVHRDLKPQNLFVGRRLNGTPLVKVLDFGIAKAVGAAAVGQMALTDSQAVIGSPLYMAPEHMRSARAADVRSDIWSLGVILYELVGGQVPFDGETVTEVCIRVVNESPASLLSLRPGLDPTLVATVMRCLEKDPANRWQNVAQLAVAIEPFSRSAKESSALRPWRSFEDTLDTNPPGVADARGAGPSTPVGTPPVGTPRAGLASGAGAAVPLSPTEPRVQLASTAVTWGAGTDRPGAATSRPSFRKGLAVGVVVSVAVAAAAFAARTGGLERFSPARPAETASLGPSPAAPVPPAATTSSGASGPASASAQAEVEPGASIADLPNAPAPGETARPAPVLGGRPRERRPARSTPVPVSAAPVAAPAPSAAATPVVTAPPAAPNGAPILR